jgi:hypothetical protein
MTHRTTGFHIFLAFSLSLLAPLQARTWKNSSGTEIVADLSGVEGSIAVLKKDGRMFRVSISTLAAADQEFIKAWKPEPARAPEAKEAKGKATTTRKKGYCLGMKKPDWTDKLKALNAGWFYMWKADKPDSTPKGIQFVPMVFGKADFIDSNVDYVKSNKRREEFEFLLGYNEPDQAKQANMTVEAALKAWPKLMSVDLPLVSPAAAKPDGEWMEKFMEGIKKGGLRVDYVAIHYYGGSDPENFLKLLERIHEKFDRPLWITEFAVADWQASKVSENRHSVADIKKFMNKVLPELERLDYVYRYAWFSAAPADPHIGTSALFKEDGSMTELGEIYSKQ